MSRPKRGSDSRLRGQASTSAQSNNSISINEVDEVTSFTHSDVLRSISTNPNELVELVAIVYKIQGPWMFKDRIGKTKHVLAFVVHNNNGDRVRLTIWDQLINKFISEIHCQHKIHIEGATPREVDNRYNDGTVPYELIVQSNTTIKDMGRTSIIYNEEKNVPLLTSSDVLRSLSPDSDEIPEIVVIVHDIKKIKPVNKTGTKTRRVLQFIVHNTNHLVQLTIWDDLIDKFIDKIQYQHIIRIERLSPRRVRSQFNAGSFGYQLVFQECTIIEDMGKTSEIYHENLDDLELVPLTSIHNHEEMIKIQGFVKLNWRIVDSTQDRKGNYSGSLVNDGRHITISISEFGSDFEIPFRRGEHVECIGKVMQTGNSLGFLVKSIDHIRKIDDIVALEKELLNSMPLSSISHPFKKFRSS